MVGEGLLWTILSALYLYLMKSNKLSGVVHIELTDERFSVTLKANVSLQ